MVHRRTLLTAALLAPLLALAGTRTAHAFEAQLCTVSPSNWNAPAGAIVANQSDGPIRAVLQGVNEILTHTIVSQGNGYATQSTSLAPSANSSNTLNLPISPDQLKDGYPGLSQAEVAGIYNFLRGSNFIMFHHSNNNAWDPAIHPWTHAYNAYWIGGVADWLWNDVPYQWVPSRDYAFGNLPFLPPRIPSGLADPGYYQLGFYRNGAFNWMPYNFHQYMSGVPRVYGGAPNYNANDFGIVCSQVAAYASANKYAASNGTIGDYIRDHVYTKTQTVNAGTALWYAVKDECLGSLGFWKSFGLGLNGLIGGSDQGDVCRRAAWQVVNCFFQGGECNNVSANPWNGWIFDASRPDGADSLSPDVLLGWGNYPHRGSGVSPWAAYVPNSLQWNGAGNIYRCWY